MNRRTPEYELALKEIISLRSEVERLTRLLEVTRENARLLSAAPSAPTQAPEAKTAESEVLDGWIRPSAVQSLRDGRFAGISVWPSPLPNDLRVRITVEPAPVEPEETP